MRITLVCSIFSILYLSGCTSYTPPMQYEVVKVREYQLSFDDTWDRTVQWVASTGEPVMNMDKDAGFISADYGIGLADTSFCDCGKDGAKFLVVAASWDQIIDVFVRWNIIIQKIDDEWSRVTVTAKYEAILEHGYTDTEIERIDNNRVPCNSKGKLEKQILDAIEFGK
jgi:hypothetical protein